MMLDMMIMAMSLLGSLASRAGVHSIWAGPKYDHGAGP
jgi:hypothetical protein